MMTGRILSGVDPLDAVQYWIPIIFLIGDFLIGDATGLSAD